MQTSDPYIESLPISIREPGIDNPKK